MHDFVSCNILSTHASFVETFWISCVIICALSESLDCEFSCIQSSKGPLRQSQLAAAIPKAGSPPQR